MPAEVRDRFVRVGRDYYFPSGAKAFRDHGQRVVTSSENVEVIRTFVQIAVARGWQDITVSGSKRFRSEAWRVATVSGLVVRGYRPSEFEKQKLVRELASARSPRTPVEPLVDAPILSSPIVADVVHNTKPEHSSARVPRTKSQASAQEADDSVAQRSSSDRSRRIYSGTLVDHGAAPFQFHRDGEASYFVRLQTQRGVELLWGKDFERALTDAQVDRGDAIRVEQAGYKTVTVKRKERDASGKVMQEHDIKAHRNRWEIRAEDKSLPHAPGGTAGEGIPDARENPDTEGALRALKASQLFADKHITDPARRTAFVNAMREELLQMANRGEVPVVELRSRDAAKVQREARSL